MNYKSLLFVITLFAIFTLSTSRVVEYEKRETADSDIIKMTLEMISKYMDREDEAKEKFANSLINDEKNKEEDENQKDEIPVDDDVQIKNPSDSKYIVVNEGDDQVENGEHLGPEVDEVEVVTVTVEVEEGTQYYELSSDKDTVKDENGDDVKVDVVGDEQPKINLNLGGKNMVDGDVIEVAADEVQGEQNNVEAGDVDAEAEQITEGEQFNDDSIGTVSYDVTEEELDAHHDEEETVYYEIKEGDYNEEDDTYNTVVTSATSEDPEKKGTSALGAIGVIGAFGVIGALGYKYNQRRKRVLLPFHEELEKGEFFDKNSNEQHIIPVWAAAKKEENEEEKEDEEKLFEVVYNYEPELPDELKLTVGDKIKIKEIYEDGWAYGYNKTTQLFGTFPSTSLGENFNPESVPQYKPEENAVEINDNMVEELKKKIVENN